MPRDELDFTERDAGVEGGHDEPSAQHVWMNVAESGSLADRPHPAVCGAAIQALSVTTLQDRPLDPLTDGEVDRARGARRERDDGGLVAFADDPQRAMSVVEGEMFDVGATCFGHS